MKPLVLFATLLTPSISLAEICSVTVPLGDGSNAQGHGVYVGNGLVLTARHVIRGNRGMASMRFLSSGKKLRGTHHYVSSAYDLAGIRVNEPAGVKPTAVVSTWPSRRVRTFRGWGMPRRGLEMFGRSVFCCMAPSVPGDSGGPIRDQQGRVVSIISVSDFRTDTLGPPPDKLVEFMQKCSRHMVAT